MGQPTTTIRILESFDADAFLAVISGFTATEAYVPQKIETDTFTRLELTLRPLAEPRKKRYVPTDEELTHYASVINLGYSVGAFKDETLVGIAIAEPHNWNRTLWVHEFHVKDGLRGEGIGRQMMQRVVANARQGELRAVVCETQSSNVPAIRFYRRVGFELDGIDMSYYTNEDMVPERGVAVFMKLKLE